MDQSSPGGEGGLLRGLRGTDPRERDGAFRTLLSEHGVKFELDSRGRVMLPAGGRVNRQPASVVQQAAADLWEHLERVLDQCGTDDELRRVFSAIVKRRDTDRLRRRGNSGVRLDAVIMNAPAAEARSAGPSTRGDTLLFDRHVDRLLDAAAGAGAQEGEGARALRRLVELHVVKGMDWAGVAAAMGESAGALKVRFTRMKPRLVEAVYGEFIASLPADLAPVARALLIDGKPTALAARELAIDEARVRHVLASEIMARMREHFGAAFLETLPRVQRHSGGE